MQNPTPENGNQGQNVAQPNTTPTPAAAGMGVNQVQNLGKAGVDGLSNIVGQFVQPMTGQVPQPPVHKDERMYGAIAYLPLVSLLSIIVKPDSAFVRLHAKQGLLLTLIFFVSLIGTAIVSVFGFIGQLLGVLLGLVPIACIIVGVYSMYLAMTGFWWKVPVLGSVADLIPIEMIAKASKENITGQVGIAKNDYDNRQDTMSQEKSQNAQTTVMPTPTTSSQNPTTTTDVPPANTVK